MNKKLQTILLAISLYFTPLGAGGHLYAQNVYIPDATFKASLVYDNTINTNGDAEIQVSEAAAFTGTINVYYLTISNLTGIEAFVNITNLDCSHNSLSTLDVLANTALIDLYCYIYSLSTLDVSANTALTNLSCYYNQLTSLNVSANTALTTLYCYNNSLSTLDVSANTALTTLNCYNNQLTSLNVSANTALTTSYCGYN